MNIARQKGHSFLSYLGAFFTRMSLHGTVRVRGQVSKNQTFYVAQTVGFGEIPCFLCFF